MANMTYELDFTGVQSSNFIEEGVHTVKIKDAEFKKAQTGSDQLQLTFEAADGKIRSAWYSLLPQALWKLKGILEVLGIPCEGKIKLNTTQFKNKTCVITVEPDASDESKLIVTKVSKSETAAPSVAYNAAPAPQMPTMPNPLVQPVQQETPQPTAPVQQAQQPVQTQLPPWMVQQHTQANAAPQGNLPPWMQQK